MHPLGNGAGNLIEWLGVVVKFERNQTIYFEGDAADYCFKVLSGTARLCKVTEDGRRQIAAFLSAGDLFGWTDQDARNFSAEAVTDLTAERFHLERIDQTVRANPTMGRRLITLLSNQLAIAHDHLLLLGRMTAAERIATFLLDLVKCQHASGTDGATVELAMNRRDIADYLGLTVETVSRTMNAMKRKGIICFAAPESVVLKQIGTLACLATGTDLGAALQSSAPPPHSRREARRQLPRMSAMGFDPPVTHLSWGHAAKPQP